MLTDLSFVYLSLTKYENIFKYRFKFISVFNIKVIGYCMIIVNWYSINKIQTVFITY